MTPPNTQPRLFVDAALTAEGRLRLDGVQAHYVNHVMRLGAGDGVVLFNGRDGEWSADIEALGKNRCSVVIGRRLRPQEAEHGPWLAFAPIKKAGTDFLVEKATELGASRLLPTITRRTNSARVNLNRLHAHAVEASEQCGRLTVPEIEAPAALERLASGWPADRRLLVLDESGEGQPIADVLADLKGGGSDPPPSCGFLSGPEGGFDPGELDALRKLDFVNAVGLGSRILRAETAALAALACWQALIGDRP
ncbi:MAG: 16S rRNA (uracil(1498)-N(3))-methyltransferase [Rhodospirillales bacterium]